MPVFSSPTPLDDLVAEAKILSAKQLEERFVSPVLLVVPTSDTMVTERLDITNPSAPSTIEAAAAQQPSKLLTLVIPVRAKSGHGKAKRLSIGRDESRDVPIPLGTISSLHAWLEETAPDAWRIVDASSTNGTWVDGRRVDTRLSTPVEDGAELKLGENLTTFWLAASFRAALLKRAGK